MAIGLGGRSNAFSFTIFRISNDQAVHSGGGEFSGFIDDRRFLVHESVGSAVYDLEGKRTAAWQFGDSSSRAVAFGPPAIAVIWPLIQQYVTLVDPLTGAELRRDLHGYFVPRVKFGDRGRIYCFQYGAQCIEVGTGRALVAPSPSIEGGGPFDVARSAPVVAATDIDESALARVLDTGAKIVKSVVVWERASKSVFRRTILVAGKLSST